MKLVSNKNIKKIFLTSNSKLEFSIDDKVSIILSPEFYWIRKFDIPVKTEAQARHLLPTLFEDIINDDQVLTYQVIKLKENEFLCFAYNNKKIYNAVKNLNIPNSNIKAFYFAQNECIDFKSFKINNEFFMYTNDNILVKVPINLIENDAIDFEKVIDKIKLTNHKLQIKLYNEFLSTKFYNYVFFILSILIFINLVKFYSYSNEVSLLNKDIEKVKKSNNLPTSMIKTNSILKNYNLTISEQIKLRKDLDFIIKNKNIKLLSISLDNKIINLGYISSSKKDVLNYLSKRFKHIEIEQNSINLKVRIKT